MYCKNSILVKPDIVIMLKLNKEKSMHFAYNVSLILKIIEKIQWTNENKKAVNIRIPAIKSKTLFCENAFKIIKITLNRNNNIEDQCKKFINFFIMLL